MELSPGLASFVTEFAQPSELSAENIFSDSHLISLSIPSNISSAKGLWVSAQAKLIVSFTDALRQLTASSNISLLSISYASISLGEYF